MMSVLVSCEHATCAVPGGQKALFEGCEDELHSFAGWEPGALNLAQAIASRVRTQLVHGEITRLLIDLEAGGDDRWTPRYADQLSEPAKERFASHLWEGYRNTLRQRIEEDLRRHDCVVHVLVHTGGPESGRAILRVPEGNADAAAIAGRWAKAASRDGLKVAVAEGGLPGTLVAALAAAHPSNRYAPIRLEVAPGYFLDGKPLRWEECKKSLIAGLEVALANG
jgi:hypothetical protein